MTDIHPFPITVDNSTSPSASPLAAYASSRAKTSMRKTAATADRWFYGVVAAISILYVLFLVELVAGLVGYTSPSRVIEILSRSAIMNSLWLTLWTSTASTAAAILIAVPICYLMGRCRFPGQGLLDAVLDIPNVFPPMVLGLALLILFQYPPLKQLSPSVVYQVPAILLVYFVVAVTCALPVLRASFKELDPRLEKVALTLGCSRLGAFLSATLPEARYGVFSAAANAWSRCFGTFGPLLVFAGATRNKTEVMATSVYLELGSGEVDGAVAVSLFMVVVAAIILSLSRWFTRHYHHAADGS